MTDCTLGVVVGSFNRTIVELKHVRERVYGSHCATFNRTIVELKQKMPTVYSNSFVRF